MDSFWCCLFLVVRFRREAGGSDFDESHPSYSLATASIQGAD